MAPSRKSDHYACAFGSRSKWPPTLFFYPPSDLQIEESFPAKLRPGDRFIFAGRVLEVRRLKDLTAIVRLAKNSKTALVPRWMGTKLPLSQKLSQKVREKINEVALGKAWNEREIHHIENMLILQQKVSQLPKIDEFLIESYENREGNHLFVFPFEGRFVNEGFAALLAYRLGKIAPATFSISVNDYGFELLSPFHFDFKKYWSKELLNLQSWDKEIKEAMNLGELAKRQFREIARVSGLVLQKVRGPEKNQRQLQASSSLLYDVFAKYDPENLWLFQAKQEVLDLHFKKTQWIDALQRVEQSKVNWVELKVISPLAFPLMVERIGARISTEELTTRIERILQQWEKQYQSKYEDKPLNASQKKQFSGTKRKPSSSRIST